MHKTPLNDAHRELGARMVEFGGWDMPVQYTGIVDEHTAVRERAGVFDVSHMGRIRFTGPEAVAFADHVTTADVAAMEPGEIRYCMCCNEDGGVLDDLLVYREEGTDVSAVVNASNREKLLEWWAGHARDGCTVEDDTFDTVLLALQGPDAASLLAPITDLDIEGLEYYRFADGDVIHKQARVSRTGYTGEDGFEIAAPAAQGPKLWQTLVEAGAVPAGLGARDTLRLEATMPLYGHELGEDINPYEAGVGFAVRLQKDADFIGRAALEKVKADGPARRLACLTADTRRVPRQGAEIFDGDDRIGIVTSGTHSPTLDRPVAMALVEPGRQEPGREYEVDIRGKRHTVTTVKRPFYKRD